MSGTTTPRGPGAIFDLTGRVAVVTGGSRGLGAEIVRAYADAGADVMIVSRKIDSCVQVADEVSASTGRRMVPHACNVSDWTACDRLYDAAYDTFGKVDVLVNNAGLSPLYDRVVDVGEALWDKVVAINMKGPFRLTALFGTRMAEDGGGSIINVSSGGSIRPRPNILPYAAAKAGLNALTVGFAHAFGPNVRVNCIMPGPFLTDISKAWDMEATNIRQQGYALKRCGEPSEIAGAALYFASEASSFTSGSVLQVDGGMP
jgi:NAD(P)-dependent dehydrogenase (short-subunit alcohol dehydrogenase family)